MNKFGMFAAAVAAIAINRAVADTYAYRVQYLESTGGQYIDTGITPSITTTFKGTYEYMSVVSGSGNLDMIAGIRSTSAGSTRYYPVSLNGGLLKERYVLSSNMVTHNHSFRTRHTIMFNDDEHRVFVDGVYMGKLTGNLATATRTCWLFGANSESKDHWFSAARIYGCELRDYGSTLRKYIPVVDTDGVACMFDEVEQKLYYNLGTGSFIAGPRLDVPLYAVEYLESTGTQWIDTGTVAKTNTQTNVGYMFTAAAQNQNAMIGGIQSPSRYYPVSIPGKSALTERYVYGSQAPETVYPALRHREVFFNDMEKKVYVDAMWNSTFTSAFTESSESMYIFAAHNVSSKKADWLSKSRVWHYDIYTNTVHVQSFVPVVDANGVPCMHEMLSGTNHYNKGSGAFSVGRIISSEVKLDLSSHTGILTGSKIISFTQRPSYCTTFTLDAEHANDIDAEVREDGVYLVGKDSTVPLWAVWTGDAGNGDIHDPANWCCMNFMWTVLDGAVPCTRTIILVTGETSIPLAAGNLPFCSSIQFSGNIKLTANCDWRGLGKFVIPDGLSIDLNANSLYLDGFMMERGTFASVTDTSDGGGELHVNVAENDVLLNDCVALLGGMRLVKEGPGIFIAALPNQQYTGGTEVTGGIFRLTYPGPTVGYQSLVGPEVNSVTVKANGIFDVNANYGQSIN